VFAPERQLHVRNVYSPNAGIETRFVAALLSLRLEEGEKGR
jgi:hypothetical protein